jgi:hypothetical protein
MRGRNRSSKPSNLLSKNFESNGPDVKIRGTAQHIAEKYMQLARDANAAGDPVAAENYYQHAEHYLRIIASVQEGFRPQPHMSAGTADTDMDQDKETDNDTADMDLSLSEQPDEKDEDAVAGLSDEENQDAPRRITRRVTGNDRKERPQRSPVRRERPIGNPGRGRPTTRRNVNSELPEETSLPAFLTAPIRSSIDPEIPAETTNKVRISADEETAAPKPRRRRVSRVNTPELSEPVTRKAVGE